MDWTKVRAVKRGGFDKAGFSAIAWAATGLLVEKENVGLCRRRMNFTVVVWVRFSMKVLPKWIRTERSSWWMVVNGRIKMHGWCLRCRGGDQRGGNQRGAIAKFAVI